MDLPTRKDRPDAFIRVEISYAAVTCQPYSDGNLRGIGMAFLKGLKSEGEKTLRLEREKAIKLDGMKALELESEK